LAEFVVLARDTPTLLDLAEEPFDQVSRAVKIWLKQIGSLRFSSAEHAPCWLESRLGQRHQARNSWPQSP
jgi:hypothetical protein